MEYFYAVGMLAIVYIVLFIVRHDLRKEMILMSFLSMPLGIFDVLFVPNYWIPQTYMHLPIGAEGFIYSFFIGGIAAVLYAEIAHKKLIKIKHYHRSYFSIISILTVLPIFLLLNYTKTFNVMICMYIALTVAMLLIWYQRRDLVRSAIFGALSFGTIYSLALIIWCTLFPQVKEWFTFQGLPKIFILNAPLYESLFGFFFAAYWGNLFELFFGYKYKKYYKNR